MRSYTLDVRGAKLHDIIGVRGNLQAFWDGKKYTTRKLACSRSTGTIGRDSVALIAKKDAVGAFVSCWDEKSKGPWLLITDLPDCGDEIVALYNLRFRIEESIRDIKQPSAGLGSGRSSNWRSSPLVGAVGGAVVVVLGHSSLRSHRAGARTREVFLDEWWSAKRPLHISSWTFPHQRLDRHPLRSPRNHANRRLAAGCVRR